MGLGVKLISTNPLAVLYRGIIFIFIGCYPARLKKVLIVTAPLWFKAPFKVLRLFVREKLRDRVFTVSTPQVAMGFLGR